ncbi:MAG: GspE/PulE family protein [Puniceicoccales bacterium]|nr:GspE/PulE family protein [Puniceicoccales bacterium]
MASWQKCALEQVNSDIIRCLLSAKITGNKLAKELAMLDADAANERLLKTLRSGRCCGKIRDAIGMEIFRGDAIPKNEKAMNFIGGRFAEHNRIAPISFENSELLLAIADPFNVRLMDDLSERFPCGVSFQLASFGQIRQFWEAHGDCASEKSAVSNGGEYSPCGGADASESQPLDKFFENLLRDAVRQRASDIHLENSSGGMRVRIRVDGRLRTTSVMDKISAQAAIAKIKIDANARIDEVRLPQDRRVRMKILNKNYDLRISILPTIHGENVAMRIFDQADNDFDLSSIGMADEQLQLLLPMIDAQNGLILLCGPTGCGKTTTLYTILKKISSPRRKVLTIEDPIEYRLDGINQVPVDDAIGLSFASTLRSVLRQSPNVIMVGEIRDSETAELAIRAALTGHLVFSTVHCGDSTGAITRLVDFGISEHLIKSCLRGAISQKLARRPCKSCATVRELSDSERSILPKCFSAVRKVPRIHGCDECCQMGSRGRIPAFDFLINKNFCSAGKFFRGREIFGDFMHAETFAESVARLLKAGDIIFEDARQLLLFR